MSDWADGYVTDVDYTYGFYKEMAPSAIRLALAAAGFEAPPLDRFTYCELGFGQGAGLNLLAAANPQGDFWGTDFNPAHAAGAEQLAHAAGLDNVHVFDDSFEQFGRRELPKFDYIALHGIYSWVSAANRRHIVEFIDRHLKVGGVVYISYNTLPGWTHALPLQGLLSQYVEHQTSPSEPITERLEAALKLLGQMNEVPGSYFKATPQLGERIKALQGQNRKYLAHEYLNGHWNPMFFASVVDELSAARLSFAAHANPINCVDPLNHSKELQAILDTIRQPVFREVVRDLGINQTFRRDLFVRGPRRLSRPDQSQALTETGYALVAERKACALKIKTHVGEATLQAESYEPVLDLLAEGPKTGQQLLAHPAGQKLGAPRLFQVLIVLVGAAYVQPCLPVALREQAVASSRRFNDAVIARTLRGGEVELAYMASPQLGSGISVPRLSQLFMHARRVLPAADVAQRAAWILDALRATGQGVVKDGKVLDSAEEAQAEIRARLEAWQTDALPLLRSLDIGG